MKMKALKVSLAIAAAALLTIGMSGAAHAFHSGGVAECGGCHSMHAPKTGAGTVGKLLIGSDQSSTCLDCHGESGQSSYHIMTRDAEMPAGTAPINRTPGGDFGWLKKTYTFVLRNATITEGGAAHGHNIIAADFGYSVDPNYATAPGGTFPSTQLGCQSCHDPHGKFRRNAAGVVSNSGLPIANSGSYHNSADPIDGKTAVGVYRLLAGLGYSKGGVTFTGAPVAVAPSSYNVAETATAQIRVAYGKGTAGGTTTWSNWCATCHADIHSSAGYRHPVDDNLGGTIKDNYDQYVKSGDMTGTNATSYSSLVPFITASANYADLKGLATTVSPASKVGPGSNDEVACLTCHRAHASGFGSMLRWSMDSEILTGMDATGASTWVTTDTKVTRGKSQTELAASYNGRLATDFAPNQRALCNKCHAKD
jgi:hypothetical protein